MGDPHRDAGYWGTSRMALEAALCLALQQRQLDASPDVHKGGVLTPASGAADAPGCSVALARAASAWCGSCCGVHCMAAPSHAQPPLGMAAAAACTAWPGPRMCSFMPSWACLGRRPRAARHGGGGLADGRSPHRAAHLPAAMGLLLVERLRAAGMTFAVLEDGGM